MRISDWSSDVCSSDLLVEPAVEAVHHGVAGLGVVAQGVLHAYALGREEEHPRQALLLHHLQADLAVLVLGTEGLELAEGLGDLLLLGVAPVPIEQRAGLRPRVKGGVGAVGVDWAPDERPPPDNEVHTE